MPPYTLQCNRVADEIQFVFISHKDAPTAAQIHEFFLPDADREPPRWGEFKIHADRTCHHVTKHADNMRVKAVRAQYGLYNAEDQLLWCRSCSLTPEQRAGCYRQWSDQPNTDDLRMDYPLIDTSMLTHLRSLEVGMHMHAPWQYPYRQHMQIVQERDYFRQHGAWPTDNPVD